MQKTILISNSTAYIPKPTEDRKPLAKNMILCKMKIRRRDAI